jgi:hypothetical protein
MDWNHLARGTDQWHAIVNTVINRRGGGMSGNYLTS